MADKVFTILLVFFVMTGLYAYDQHMQQKNGYSPIAKFIDMGRFGRKEDPLLGSTIIQRKQKFYLNSKENLKRLSRQFRDIEAKRRDLLAKRQKILSGLILTEEQIKKDAEVFSGVVRKEQEKFMERYAKIEPLVQDIVKAQKEQDPIKRERNYERIKIDVIRLFEAVINRPEQRLDELGSILKKIEDVVGQSDEAWKNDCKSGDIEMCLKNRSDDIEAEVGGLFKKVIEWPNQDAQQLIDLVVLLDEERESYKKDFETVNQELAEKSREIESKLQSIIKGLVELSDVAIEEILAEYQGLNQELEMVLMNLEWSQNRLAYSYNRVQSHMRGIIRSLDEDYAIDASKVVYSYNNFDKAKRNIFDNIDKNKVQVSSIYEDKKNVDKEVFKILREKIDLEASNIAESAKLNVTAGDQIFSNNKKTKRNASVSSKDLDERRKKNQENIKDLKDSRAKSARDFRKTIEESKKRMEEHRKLKSGVDDQLKEFMEKNR